MYWLIGGWLAVMLCLDLSGCSETPPANRENLCAIFQEKDGWYKAAHAVHQKYQVPINVAMAIMAQESNFVDNARPPMRWFLFIPYGRESSAFGYAQALDSVWDDYVEDAGSFLSSRDDFADALDFIGWFMVKTQRANGVALGDAYNQYLNYHEGWNGFRNETYRNKAWLEQAARAVRTRAEIFRKQLLGCNLY